MQIFDVAASNQLMCILCLVIEEHEVLQKYLVELSAHGLSILDWNIGGKVYMEYINICRSMKQISKV